MNDTTDRRTGNDNLRILGVEVTEGLLGVLREPAALFFSVLMPVLFFALFASLYGGQPAGPGELPVAAAMLATYGTFAVVSVMLINPGVNVADDRTRGWLRMKKVSAAPIGTTIAAKVIAALPYAAGSFLAISALSLAINGPVVELDSWLRLGGVLLLGSLPFALFGLAIGFVMSTNTAVALLNAILFPMVIASGLWIPLQFLPGWVGGVAQVLPTYHLAQLAQAQLTGAGGLGHLVALLVSTVVAGALAGLAYRNLRV
jgi:ABC-2 type transport system permease protein